MFIMSEFLAKLGLEKADWFCLTMSLNGNCTDVHNNYTLFEK